MPVTYVEIEWPDSQKDKVYSPSSVIKEYFKPGETLQVDEFLKKCSKALTEASERVRLKFGYGCTSAESELHRIQKKCATFSSKKTISVK